MYVGGGTAKLPLEVEEEEEEEEQRGGAEEIDLT